MTTNSGVPAWARPIVKALLGLGEALLRHGDDGVALDASKLGRACLAALASDAAAHPGWRTCASCHHHYAPEASECPRCGSTACTKISITAPAPAPGDASGETAFGNALGEYVEALLDFGREYGSWTPEKRERELQRRQACRAECLRLYRAATGEVTGHIELTGERPGEYPTVTNMAPEPIPEGQRRVYDLVRRRDKEGV